MGDFFELGGDDSSPLFDLIYDCTFLCAIPPERREEWAVVMERNLASGGELVTLIFPVVPGRSDSADPALSEGAMPGGGGPPWRMTVPLVQGLCEGVGLVLVGEVERVSDEDKARGFAGEYIARWRKPAAEGGAEVKKE